jgi:hypothetical protein
MLKGIMQDLRNAFDAHDRPAHEDILKRLERLGNIDTTNGCTRGDACVCNKHVKDVCMYRVHQKKP